jgi:hypothetical protein
MKKGTKKIKAWVYRPPGKRLYATAQKLIPERKRIFISGIQTVCAVPIAIGTLQGATGCPGE